MYPEYPPVLNGEQQDYLLANLKDWSIAHGLAVRPPPSYIKPEQDPTGALATTAPVTLFPSLLPRVCFEQAKSVARAYNELYSAIASDEGWLKGIVEEYVCLCFSRKVDILELIFSQLTHAFNDLSHVPARDSDH